MSISTTKPIVITILGGTGDLSQRKLLPSLYNLYLHGYLPEKWVVLGVSRKSKTNDEFRQFARAAIYEHGNQETEVEDEFLKRLFYVSGDLVDNDFYKNLGVQIDGLTKDWKQCYDRMFYAALIPKLYEQVFECLSHSGLMTYCDSEVGQSRLLVEKPFGRDLSTAQALDQKLGALFTEDQIFRIDHYLAKNAIQNILTFRFSNTLLEHTWSNKEIESVHIKMLETHTIYDRGAFYDGMGALRDVGQNHLLQLLALVAMDHPGDMSAGELRSSRAKVMQDLQCIDSGKITEHAVRGQYAGYTDVDKVDSDSSTETYFFIKALIDNERWQGVPFYLESGKAMKDSGVAVTINFKPLAKCVCEIDNCQHGNRLVINVQPEQHITMTLMVKKPGLGFDLEEQDLTYRYEKANGFEPAAYEKILFDGICGDQTLFVSTEEILASWGFVSSILDAWSDVPLEIYDQASEGPDTNHLIK